MTVTIHGRDIAVRALIDYYPAVEPEIRYHREDSTPGRPAFCEVKSVELAGGPEDVDPDDLVTAAQDEAEDRIAQIAGLAALQPAEQ